MCVANSSNTWEKLDSEFDHHLVDMKPYVLKLPHKTERQLCALWIKKLCDPGVSGSGLMGRKNRNMYARLLLHMLRRGVLEGPFSHKPESGSLKTLPTYMSIYFDEPLCGRGLEQSTAGLPDWVTGELGQGDDSWDSLLRERVDGHRKPGVPSPDDSDLETRLNSWNLGVCLPGPHSLTLPLLFCPSPVLHLTMCVLTPLSVMVLCVSVQAERLKTKVLEAKHQEEKLKMQQRHDADVQKILDRKNGEIDELKTMYRAKQKESEESVRKLEKKVQSVLRESQVIRESKEKQIGELKKMSDQSTDSLKNEWEKKLHAAVAGMEQEKFDLQKKQTENIQVLLEDTNQRLAKMEAEYGAQTQATDQTVRELELRVKQLSVEVENGNVLRQKVTQEKGQLEIHIASISSELQEANRQRVSLLREKEQQSEQHEDTLQRLQTKHEADISHFQQEHTLSAAKASDVIEDLEQTVAQLRQQLQDSEHRRLKQLGVNCVCVCVRVRTASFQNWKKLPSLPWAQGLWWSACVCVNVCMCFREKEEQLGRERECQRQQTQQAENALEHFKKQVEISSEKTYANMKLQMDKVEEDLTRSKSLREKQAKEFSYQVEELKQKYEQQVRQEQERMRLQQHYSTERDNLVQQRQREVGTMEREARAALHQHQHQTQEWRQHDAQVISDLEEQVSSLRDELQQAHSQRKQQLLELGVLREEERQRAAQDQEASLGRLRAEMDHIRLELETSHKAERQLAQEKTNTRLKQIEKEYSQKLAKSAQLIAELQTSVRGAKEEGLRQQQEKERQLKEATARWDDERRQMSRHTDTKNKVLQEKMENLQRQLHSSEKKLLNKELENQEQVTVVLQECAMKMKGLMPAELRQELEDTISSLKSQVGTSPAWDTIHRTLTAYI
uniref:Centrosomal protein 112 n=1 Tax=Oncorhynchus mykiss TaxID=8022 RepID=A0A8K9XWF7_ONCMY